MTSSGRPHVCNSLMTSSRTRDQTSHSRTGAPQPHRRPSTTPRSHRWVSSPHEKKPGTWPSKFPMLVLPLRPHPAMKTSLTFASIVSRLPGEGSESANRERLHTVQKHISAHEAARVPPAIDLRASPATKESSEAGPHHRHNGARRILSR